MDVNKLDECWIAVQVRPRYELTTARILRNKGYEEFVPTCRSKRQWSDRRREIEMPLFTGYVFCRIKAEICGPIVTTPGVIRILSIGKKIARIEDSEIEAIQAVVKSGMNVQPYPYLNVGDIVRITNGPLTGVEGIVTKYNNRRHLILSVNMVQRAVLVEIDGWSVAPVHGEEKISKNEGQPEAMQVAAPILASQCIPGISEI